MLFAAEHVCKLGYFERPYYFLLKPSLILRVLYRRMVDLIVFNGAGL